MRKLKLALLSALLLAFSWPEIGFIPLLFVGFIPLLILEKETQSGKLVFCYSFLSFFIFNGITTYWVYHATLFGAIAAFFVNATLMATAFWLFHKIKKATNNRLGYLSLVVVWISMEYLHLNWDLSWPWLTLGNGFATSPSIVQWYEFTGFLGGSLWVLIVNLLLFNLYLAEDKVKAVMLPLLVILLPMFVSYHMYLDYESNDDNTISVVIVQPNVDPYTASFLLGTSSNWLILLLWQKLNLHKKLNF